MFADLALINGNIITMNSSKPSAEAIAIKKDRIVEVGTNEEIKSWIGKRTKLIKLQGKTVVPGLIDSHIHVTDFGKFLAWLDLKNVNSIEELQKRVRESAQKMPKGKWIIGHGWDQTFFDKKLYPTFQDLDKVSPYNPVILYHQSGRVCVVNSKALRLAGVTKETKAPSGSKIDKDPKTGRPNGILRENATDLVWKLIPPSSEADLVVATNSACQKIVESGVTSIHWIITSSNEISIIKRLRAEKKLPLRIQIICPANILEHLDNPNELVAPKEHKVKFLGVKIFVDGFLAARTAALHEPYIDVPTTKGQLMYTQKELNKLVVNAHKFNCGLVFHAMGDQAIEMTLTAIENALIETSRKKLRYRIEHASVLNQDLIQHISKLGVIISVQPKCVISEFSVWSAIDRIGSERSKWLYPIKTLINQGIRVIGGSDCPMEPLSPLVGIQAAVTRQFFPDEQITVDEALKMYTINAAYASSEEGVKGSIDEGKLADLTVLSGDPRTVPSNKIGDISVKMTVVGGKVVYQQ